MEILTLTLVGIIALMVPFTITGYYVVYNVLIRKQKKPANESNRLNHARLVWFALTREDKFVELFPWLKNDEWENIN